MPKTKEERAEQQRVYNQTPAGQKRRRIGNWKEHGIISDDWDALHERFMSTTHCENCDVLLTGGMSRTGKCLDHDHSIKDRENVRAVLCNACNANDKCTNTSGVPNVHYDKWGDRWVYIKMVNRVSHQKYFKTKEDAIRYKYEYETRHQTAS
tara:strand:+ start:265 stop:720 length:456 start_codon:yes stop_codon:yes gene_type:complete